MFPLDQLLKGDLKDIRGDLRKPVDKAAKELESKLAKLEKAAAAGGVAAETAEETERERRWMQLQLCEYLIKVCDVRSRKSVELLDHLVEYYRAQQSFFAEGLKTIEHFSSYVTQELAATVTAVRQRQEEEKKQLFDLRVTLKEALALREPPTITPGYQLHQPAGDRAFGSSKTGHLLKRSEGKMRRVWQKRRVTVESGSLAVCHSDETKPPVILSLLTCQIREVLDEKDKFRFDVLSSSTNRTYHFMADDDVQLREWLAVLRNGKADALSRAFSDEQSGDGMKELAQGLLAHIRIMPGNQTCADCGAPDPEWLVTNLGVMVCIECCGLHRDLGVHISKTQSTRIDRLGTAQLLLALSLGNTAANEVLEASVDAMLPDEKVRKPSPGCSMEARRAFIRAKYVQHRLCVRTCSNAEELHSEMQRAVSETDVQALLQCFVEGATLLDPLPQECNSRTILHMLCAGGDESRNLPLIYFLVENRDFPGICSSAGLNGRDADGNTALHLCAENNWTEAGKLLLRAGATMSIENNEAKTPLQIAEEKGHKEASELLRQALSGSTDQLENVHADWDLIKSHQLYDTVYPSDDEIDEKSPMRPLPSPETPHAPSKPVDTTPRRLPPAPPPAKDKPKILTLHRRMPSDPGLLDFQHSRRPPNLPPGARLVIPPFNGESGIGFLHSTPKKPPPTNGAANNGNGHAVPEDAAHQTPSPSLRPVPTPRARKKVRCRALFDCDADHPDELSFKEGAIIVVLRRPESDPWWHGFAEAEPERSGLFPSGYVQLIEE